MKQTRLIMDSLMSLIEKRPPLKEWIGHSMIERFYQNLANKLGATTHYYRGNEWWMDEYTIPYLKIDRDHTETLLYLHGFSDRKESFLLVARHLAQTFNIIIPDGPGFGKTIKNHSLPFQIEHYARWFERFIREVAEPPIWIAGNSGGGAIASKLAFLYPELVKLCIPISPALYYNPGNNPFFEEFANGKFLFFVSDQKDYDYYLTRIFHKEIKPIRFITDAILAEFIRNRYWYKHMIETNLKGFHSDLKELEETGFFLNKELEKTNVPFHFLWGEFDTLFPSETAKYLQTLNPSIKYDLVKKCGHAPHVEKPLKLAKMILSIYKENRHLKTRWNQW